MKRILIPTLIGGVLVSPLSAALTALNFSPASVASWNAANPDPTTLTATSGPMTFNDVLGIVGCSITIDFAGTYDGNATDNLLDGAGFDNRINGGTNTWTVTLGSVLPFQISMTTHHGPDELNTLTVGGGTFDTTSFNVTGDTVSGTGGGSLPTAVFTAGDTVATMNPYPWITGQANTNATYPEWTIDGTGSSFTYTQDTTMNGDGAGSVLHRNQFQISIDPDDHPVPEPSHTLLLGLASLALLARRRK